MEGMVQDKGAPHWSARLRRGLLQLPGALLDLCFPGRCAACGKTWLLSCEGFWCRSCLENLPWIGSPLCPRCGRPFLKSPESADHLCGDCLLCVFPFDSARSAVQHLGVVRERIHQLKFGARLHWAPALVALLEMTLAKHPLPELHCVLPVPLHRKRLRQRGFNQAGLLARILAKSLRLPVYFDVLMRSQWTEPQTRLTRQERLANVKGAFAVGRAEAVKGWSVLLVDDVFTTGTTLSECTATLKTAGVGAVHALTVTRALPDWKTFQGVTQTAGEGSRVTDER